jgi:hypothetical protein
MTASDVDPTMTAAPDFVESVTCLANTKATASILVELVTGSETTMNPATVSVPTMKASDKVETVPGSETTMTSKMSTTSYFYKASSRKSSYVKNTIFNMVLGTPPCTDSKFVNPPVPEIETSKPSEFDKLPECHDRITA